MNDFAPLHIISGYSFLKSGLTINTIKNYVLKNDYFGMGLTDDQVMFGIPEFVKAGKSINKPTIVGMDLKINNDTLSLFVLNEDGYRNLIMISTSIQKEIFNFEFLKSHCNGLAAIIETKYGNFREKFDTASNIQEFTKYLITYSSVFKDNFILGIEVTSREDVAYANKIRKFANEYTYECIAFPRIKYAKKDDAIVLKIVSAIANKETLSEKKCAGQEYFMSIDDYRKIYTQKEISKTKELIELSTFEFDQTRGQMLHFPVDDAKEELRKICFESLKAKGLDSNQNYIDQLNYELDTIISMGYADYFLLVQDYVNWAKNNNAFVGPGRGSAAGALVSYLLNIAEIDPIQFDLQFERFLNPFRKTMPDIDVDFADIKRDDVVQYVREKYGSNKVANIITFSTFGAKQSLIDVGKVYGYPPAHISLISKRLTNKDCNLRESYKILPEFKSLVDSDKYYLEIVSLASKIEGLPRQSSLHAAGVVLNNEPFDDSMPVLIDFNGNYITQYEMHYLEPQGFLKMDFLGLRNLTTIALCVNLINARHKDAHLNTYNIPYDCKEIYDVIASGKTMGVFQLESSGMKKAIKTLKPTCFDDIVALIALFRPGPMRFIKNYADRKEGKEKINYFAPELEKILAPTFGIIVYQEQINQIARVMAGFSMGEADLFRRAVSKKNKEVMLENETKFIEGAIKNGHSRKVSKEVFDHILEFANYGFNKSHSVVYSIITCRMAYLKAFYPLEFYSAILQTAVSTSDNKFNEYVTEIKSMNIDILPPNINESTRVFEIKNNGLLFPLSSIDGIKDLLVQNIIAERENGPFKDFFDFVLRMFPYKISEAQITKLVYSGALDVLYPSRASLEVNIKQALQFAELNYKEDGQLSMGIMEMLTPTMIEDHDDPLLNLDREYETIGIMLSSNPLKYKKDLLKANNVMPIIEAMDEYQAKICGIIKTKKLITTKKGTTMAFIKIFDETAEIEVTIFSNLYSETLSYLEKNNIIIVEGRFDNKTNERIFVADSIQLLEE